MVGMLAMVQRFVWLIRVMMARVVAVVRRWLALLLRVEGVLCIVILGLVVHCALLLMALIIVVLVRCRALPD